MLSHRGGRSVAVALLAQATADQALLRRSSPDRSRARPEAVCDAAQGEPVAAPSTDVSLRLRPPQALNQRPVGASEDFREYIKEVFAACSLEPAYITCADMI